MKNKIIIDGKYKPSELEFHGITIHPEMLICAYSKDTTINNWINKEDAIRIVEFLREEFKI